MDPQLPPAPHFNAKSLKTNKVTAPFPTTTSDVEASIATGAGSVWLMTDANGTLSRFDPAANRVVAKIQLPTGSYGLTFGEGALWVTSTEHGTIARVDPAKNLVAATIPVGPSPRFIAAGEGAIWALHQGDGRVSRIDPKTNELVATIDVGAEDYAEIAVGEGSVWVSADGPDGELPRSVASGVRWCGRCVAGIRGRLRP